jgi:hypothetical protein
MFNEALGGDLAGMVLHVYGPEPSRRSGLWGSLNPRQAALQFVR